MYVDPFVAGVVCTLLAEMLVIVLYAVFKSVGGKK